MAMTDTERLAEIKQKLRLAWHDVNCALLFHDDLVQVPEAAATPERWARAEASWQKANERLETLLTLQDRLLKVMRKRRLDADVPAAMDLDI